MAHAARLSRLSRRLTTTQTPCQGPSAHIKVGYAAAPHGCRQAQLRTTVGDGHDRCAAGGQPQACPKSWAGRTGISPRSGGRARSMAQGDRDPSAVIPLLISALSGVCGRGLQDVPPISERLLDANAGPPPDCAANRRPVPPWRTDGPQHAWGAGGADTGAGAQPPESARSTCPQRQPLEAWQALGIPNLVTPCLWLGDEPASATCNRRPSACCGDVR